MLDVLVVVSTCSRPFGVSYLEATLTSLDAAGADLKTKVVLSDGRLPPNVTCPWPYIEMENAFPSSRNNLQAAFRMAFEVGAERLLFFEDDVVACGNAVTAMAAQEISSDAAFVTFHDVKEIEDDHRPGLVSTPIHGHDGRGFWGLQAVAFPRRTIRELAAADFFSVWKEEPSRCSDRALEYLVARFHSRYHVHVPSLVRHVGHTSAAHPGLTLSKRGTRNYLGDDFDAACLTRAAESRRKDVAVVMTSPRAGGASYLDETLRRLDLEGAGHPDLKKNVFSDGPLRPGFPRLASWDVREYEGPSTVKNALWRVFRWAANKNFRRLILFEDDVAPRRNAVTRVLGTGVPAGAAFLSFFDYRSCAPETSDGFYLLTQESTKGGRYWGFQGVVFPGEVVAFLAEYDPRDIKAGGSDDAVWELLQRSPWRQVAIHTPSLFDHVGEVSTQPNPVMHRPLRLLSEGGDALLLPTYKSCTRLDLPKE